MQYIVFDMEWNQPMPGQKLVYTDDRCLHNEIMQIGAVKTDASGVILDTFTADIKPQKYRHINRNVKKLTGIDERSLADAPLLAEAIEDFKAFCGDDFVFVTWGYDDIRVLGNNLRFFGLDTDWLPPCYNLQMIFCAQIEGEKRQYALSFATEYFQITVDRPLHNALTDAYYTARVLEKLDMNAGVEGYRSMVFKDRSVPEHMKNIRYSQKHQRVKTYEHIMRISVNAPHKCPDCKKEMTVTQTAAKGEYQFMTFCECEEHGPFVFVFKVNKNGEENFTALEQCFQITPFNRDHFKRMAEKLVEPKQKKRRRRWWSRGKAKKPAASGIG